ncbi:MAG: hypothetical protein LBL24_03480, partial [Bacteroidales bacterium]|nr:hypothetical protein [Bacteroidales bacterium]
MIDDPPNRLLNMIIIYNDPDRVKTLQKIPLNTFQQFFQIYYTAAFYFYVSHIIFIFKILES